MFFYQSDVKEASGMHVEYSFRIRNGKTKYISQTVKSALLLYYFGLALIDTLDLIEEAWRVAEKF